VNIRGFRADVLLAGCAVLLALLLGTLDPGKSIPPMPSALALAGLRRWPKTVLVIEALLTLLSSRGYSPYITVVTTVLMLIALGVVAYRTSWRVTVIGAILIYLVLLVSVLFAADEKPPVHIKDLQVKDLQVKNLSLPEMPLPLVAIAGLTAAPVASGRYIRGVRQAAAVEQEHAAAQQRVESRAAQLTERSRLARDLHDAVAHHVGAMTLRASSAKLALETGGDPTVAASALGDVATTGRRVLDELRGLLLLLRDPDQGDGPGLLADPEATLLDAVEQVRTTGVPVTVDLDPALAESSLLVRATVARAVREALTNVLKHAGPGTPTTITVAPVHGRLRAVVHNDPPASARPVLPSSGHGLAGMRERVALLGGVLEAGPAPGGGWSVIVELPAREDR